MIYAGTGILWSLHDQSQVIHQIYFFVQKLLCISKIMWFMLVYFMKFAWSVSSYSPNLFSLCKNYHALWWMLWNIYCTRKKIQIKVDPALRVDVTPCVFYWRHCWNVWCSQITENTYVTQKCAWSYWHAYLHYDWDWDLELGSWQ